MSSEDDTEYFTSNDISKITKQTLKCWLGDKIKYIKAQNCHDIL